MDIKSFMTQFPINLNAQQQEAVEAVEGPVLLLAVPGSGKTTVLVARLGYMIYGLGVNPANILTLTYTVAATNDMRERFSSFFGYELGSRVQFRTINSICAGIIKKCADMLGKKAYELESDDKVLLGIISTLYLKYEDEYPTDSDLKGIKSLISYIKNMLLDDEEIKKLEKDAGVHLLDIYKAYCKELTSRSLMDYDDQMVYAYNLLKAVPDLLVYYQNLYPYICVDEAQDTSKIQHEIIALLASKNENLFMVGDEDQSIYGFRAAYPEALLEFEQNHPGAKILLMEENYRSNANIVDAADSFIQKNTLRHKKHMKATKANESEIKKISIKSRKAQYSYLLKVASDCTEQTAVLYRENESVVPLVDMLERNNVDYRIKNAELTFFTNRMVVDIQNILRFAYDMNNAELFEKIYYKISSYLNKKNALEACSISGDYNISIFSAIRTHMEINPHTRRSLKALETHFINMKSETPVKAINRIINHMGYDDYIESSGMKDSKIAILKSIASMEDSIPAFLDRMEELAEIFKNKKNDMNCKFILSTIHASKGLEYDNVFLIDVQDGLFPESVPANLKKASHEDIDIYEEERRLFYVGVTRAKNNLFIFKTHEGATFTKQLLNKDWTEEDDDNFMTNRLSTNNSISQRYNKPQEKTNISIQERPYASSTRGYSQADYQQFVDNLAERVVVTHKKYGEGVITSIDEETVTILFEKTEKNFNLKVLFKNKLLR